MELEDRNEDVERLEDKLSDLNMKEEKRENEDDTAELKAKFNMLLQRAKERSRNGDLQGCLELYKKAYKIHHSDKLMKRIAKLQAILAASDSDSDLESEGDFVDCGNGFKLSENIYNKLYPYQKEGVAWFWTLYKERKGGILGDDMGLGKTIQVISFLSGMFEQGHIKTALIIMPVSLMANWGKELKKWAPNIRVSDFHGRGVKQRTDNLLRVQTRNGICLTTYGMTYTSHEQFSTLYGRDFIWDYIILDEGHKIKNTANKTTKAIRQIHARNRFILTGTPIQNNLREMWALFDFVCEGQLLGTSRSFKQEYENRIVRARERDATVYEKRMGQEMSEHLRQLIAPHFLRRTKAILENKTDKADMEDGSVGNDSKPENEQRSDTSQQSKGTEKPKLTRKNDFIIWLYLSDAQLQIYRDFVTLDRVKEVLMSKRLPLAELNVLKKVCDHPRLLSTMACQQLGLSDEQDEDDNYGAKHEWCSPPVEQLIQESGKMVFLVDLLEHLKEGGHRTLVFSQSRKMLDIIEKVLKNKGVKIIRIDGTITSIVERESRINAFQNDPSYTVFLLTTQVGGVGLTLTAADRVVIFDPSWNPATDAQAVDRAYRIGQKKTVVIYRLITCGSLEEKIYRKQVFKQAITKQTTGSSKNPFRYFTSQELRELFVLDDPKSSKTQKQLEEMHSANRQTDEKLDDHILFLKNTNIFGISDHDLLFTKEADSTKEELEAAVEMGDAIQAKVRQAADLLRMESSQARNNNNQVGNNKPVVQNDENANKARTQTKISDHVEVFVPSKNDNKRFMPKINKKQIQQDFEVIDITEVGDTNEQNEEVLSEYFSAITLNGKDSAENSPSNKNDIVQFEDDDHGLVQGLSDTPIDHQKHGISSGHNDHEISQKIAGSNHSTPKKNVEGIQGDSPKNISDNTTAKTSNIAKGFKDSVEIVNKENGYIDDAIYPVSDGTMHDRSSIGDSSSLDDHTDLPSMYSDDDNAFATASAKKKRTVIPDDSDEETEVTTRTSGFGVKQSAENDSCIVNDSEDEEKEDTASHKIFNTRPDQDIVEKEDTEDQSLIDEDDLIARRNERISIVISGEIVFSGESEDENFSTRNRNMKNRHRNVISDDSEDDEVISGNENEESLSKNGKLKNRNIISDESEDDEIKEEDISVEIKSEDESFSKRNRKRHGTMISDDNEDGRTKEEDISVEIKSEDETFSPKNRNSTAKNRQRSNNSDDSEEESYCVDIKSEDESFSKKNRNRKMSENTKEKRKSVEIKSEDRESLKNRNVYRRSSDGSEEQRSSEESENDSNDEEKGEENGTVIKERTINNQNGTDNLRMVSVKKESSMAVDHGEIEDNKSDVFKKDEEENEKINQEHPRNNLVSESDYLSCENDDGAGEDQAGLNGDDGGNRDGDDGSIGGTEDSEERMGEVKETGDVGNDSVSDGSGSSVDNKDREGTDEDGSETPDDTGSSEEKSDVTDESCDSPKKKAESCEEDNKENIPKNTLRQDNSSKNVLTPKKTSKKTTCCPRDRHVSENVNIRRCPCVMTSEQQDAYKMHIKTARRSEKAGDLQTAMSHFIKAFKLCDSDEHLHYKIKIIHDAIKQR